MRPTDSCSQSPSSCDPEQDLGIVSVGQRADGTEHGVFTHTAMLADPLIAESAAHCRPRLRKLAAIQGGGHGSAILRNDPSAEDRWFRTCRRTSKLLHHKTLDDYDFAFQPELDPRKVKDLATPSFIEAKANAALRGPPGSARPTSPAPWQSRLAGPATRSSSPPSTTWSPTSKPLTPPAP